MQIGFKSKLGRWLTHWLAKEPDSDAGNAYLYDFERLSSELRAGDVLLIEGRSRVSNVIKMITQSPWTHAALYVGRLYDVTNPKVRETLQAHYDGSPDEQLIIEALLGEGTVIHPLSKYRQDHLRICRPKGLSPADGQRVLGFAVNKLGLDYDVRQLLDLARFMFPYTIVPRRWRSSLFVHNAGPQTRTVCSTMLAEAFDSVDFPILPFVGKEQNRFHLYKRNPRLLTPKDFDYSPYFDIIKYPFFGIDDVTLYRQLPWSDSHLYCNDLSDCRPPVSVTPAPEALMEPEETPAVPMEPEETPEALVEPEETRAEHVLESELGDNGPEDGRTRQFVNLLEAMLPGGARREARNRDH